MTILVTGAAGFIGMHVAQRLLARGDRVIGLDSLNDYYDVQLKRDRLKNLVSFPRFRFVEMNLTDRAGLNQLFEAEAITHVVNLAAQAGVRYGLDHPHEYLESNIVGFLNILECSRHYQIAHLVYASSSSVYGANTKMPFSVHDGVDHPISLYAATKRANELMAHTYSHLFQLPTTGLRFFTVYGPWGRPDMSPFLFTKATLAGTPIDVFNEGRMQRDFTYVDDIAEGVVRITDLTAAPNSSFSMETPDPATSYAPFRVYNIGNNQPVPLLEYIEAIEEACGKKAVKNFLPMQPGDVPATYADIDDLTAATGFRPQTDLKTGIRHFVAWYRDYYQV